MDAKLKRKWLKALRGGKYQQAQFRLKDGRGFCCLGVLCDIQGADFDAIENKYGTLSLQQNPDEYLGALTSRQRDTLARMNDEEKTFPEIADYIEANL